MLNPFILSFEHVHCLNDMLNRNVHHLAQCVLNGDYIFVQIFKYLIF
jgi:hypothetical protein